MQENELKNMWKVLEAKLDETRLLNMQSIIQNVQTFGQLQALKAGNKMTSLLRIKKAVMLLGVVWTALLLFLVWANGFSNLYFCISLLCIAAVTFMAVLVYARHIWLISQLDFSSNIVKVQQKICALQTSTIQITRILFLQSPFYCTWFWSAQMIQGSGMKFWLISVPIALFFTMVSVWLYKNIRIENAGKKWFRFLFSGREWTLLTDALQYMQEVEDFKKDNLAGY
ncbi:MAG: hypothetical protein RL172_1258 [Bacteroidota bacterium]|jgi:hypothetical protein